MASSYSQLQQQIDKLTKEKEMLLQKERPAVIAELNQKIQAYGITASELRFSDKRRKLQPTQMRAIKAKEAAARKSNGIEKVKANGKTSLPPKYKLGEQSWSGMGKRPNWLHAHLNKGGSLDQIRIQ